MSHINTILQFHGECDLVLVEAPAFEKDKPLSIFVRTTIRYFYSYVEAAVVRIGKDSLEVTSFGEHALNGVESADLSEGLAGYPINHWESPKRHVFDVMISPTENITIRTFKDWVSVSIGGGNSARFGDSMGIMGSYDGRMLARDGKTVIADPVAFGQEWQVSEDEPMLFRTVREPQSPKKCIMPSTDEETTTKRRRLGDASVVSRERAEEACANFTGGRKAACVFDGG